MLLERRGPDGPHAEDGPVPERRSRHHVARTSTARCTSSTTAPRPTSTSATTSGSPTPPSTATATTPPARSTCPSSRRSGAGDYRGKTVQVIPHVTDEIKGCIRKLGRPGRGRGHHRDRRHRRRHRGDAVLGGDPPVRPGRRARQNCLFVHLTLVPYLKAAGELKTKPTQHSVRELREIGIQPDVLICRTEREIPKDECEKIALMCNVERRAVIEEKDKEFSIYEVPLQPRRQQAGRVDRGQARPRPPPEPLEIDDWRQMLDRMRQPGARGDDRLRRASTCKHRDAYKCVYEALDHAGIAHHAQGAGPADRVREARAGGGREAPGRGGRPARARRVRQARHRRQDRGHPLRPGDRPAVLRHLPGAPVRRPSSSPGTWLGLAEANCTEFDKATPAPGRVPAGRAAGGDAPRRHAAARGVPVPPQAGHAGARRPTARTW